MSFYSVIVDFSGGSFVSQITATDHLDAIDKWIDGGGNANASAQFIHSNVEKLKTQLAQSLTDPDFPPSLLENCRNLWQKSFKIQGKKGVMHIVKTEI